MNGMTSALATPRAIQMSASSRPNSMRIGKEIQIEGEHAGETDAERLDGPARLRIGAPDQLLDEDETEDRESEAHAERQRAGPPRSAPP